jgi:hypothetical protein
MGCELSPTNPARPWIGVRAGQSSLGRAVELRSSGGARRATLLGLGADCAVVEAPLGARVGDRAMLTLDDHAELQCTVERVRGTRLQLTFGTTEEDEQGCPWPLQRAA